MTNTRSEVFVDASLNSLNSRIAAVLDGLQSNYDIVAVTMIFDGARYIATIFHAPKKEY